MTILTPAQAEHVDDLIHDPIVGLLAIGRRMLTKDNDPGLIAGILDVLVASDDAAVKVMLTGHECPQCRAMHDHDQWPSSWEDNPYCGQECSDDAAQAQHETWAVAA